MKQSLRWTILKHLLDLPRIDSLLQIEGTLKADWYFLAQVGIEQQSSYQHLLTQLQSPGAKGFISSNSDSAEPQK